MSQNSKSRRDSAVKKQKKQDQCQRRAGEPFGVNKNPVAKQGVFFTGDMDAAAVTIAINVKRGLKTVYMTGNGYEKAMLVATKISDECATLGVTLSPCDIPIGVRPVNKSGTFYTWMPHQYSTGEECDTAPVRIIIDGGYRYIGVNEDGGHLLERLDDHAH